MRVKNSNKTKDSRNYSYNCCRTMSKKQVEKKGSYYKRIIKQTSNTQVREHPFPKNKLAS